ncbi:hypothetical protein NMY22_g12554 [Coprinellus aureogranulatus]|nr:hypothetical protein NMY22_g12554 [Coprinellus aureogranulatus]
MDSPPTSSSEPASSASDTFDMIAKALEPLGLRHLPEVKRDVTFEIGNATEDLTRRIADTEEETNNIKEDISMKYGKLGRRVDEFSTHLTFLEEKSKETEGRMELRGTTAQLQSALSLARHALAVAEQARADIVSLKVELENARRKISSLQLDMAGMGRGKEVASGRQRTGRVLQVKPTSRRVGWGDN